MFIIIIKIKANIKVEMCYYLLTNLYIIKCYKLIRVINYQLIIIHYYYTILFCCIHTHIITNPNYC